MKTKLITSLFCAATIAAFTISAHAKKLRFNNPLPESRPETVEINNFANEVLQILTVN